LHPEVLKVGKLKRAKMFYAAGDYQKAMTQLSEGFNINSLKFRFDVAYAKAITDKFNNNAKGMVASLMMKK
jgi:hypothetical protein